MTLWVGTSGWQYKDWPGHLYPLDPKLPQRLWLEHYSARYRTVEVNNAFYRLPERSTFEAWAERTPEDFIVTVKASRYLTHIKRLRDPVEPVGRLMERAAGLGRKLGPVLLQLPPRMALDVGSLDEALDAFPAGVRVAVEPRDPAWWVDEVREVLTMHNAGYCWADRATEVVGPLWRTADWGYHRFHHGISWAQPDYADETLARWVERISTEYDVAADVFVYFNNDPTGAAIRDSIRFAALAEAAGWEVTRVPEDVPDRR
ncbi:MAG TPA: DUF72 domain-containing protein [Mycobacteriales bacterium]|nr:DUF72 domain-containing protein [Mycobacteriales bacterium]